MGGKPNVSHPFHQKWEGGKKALINTDFFKKKTEVSIPQLTSDIHQINDPSGQFSMYFYVIMSDLATCRPIIIALYNARSWAVFSVSPQVFDEREERVYLLFNFLALIRRPHARDNRHKRNPLMLSDGDEYVYRKYSATKSVSVEFSPRSLAHPQLMTYPVSF